MTEELRAVVCTRTEAGYLRTKQQERFARLEPKENEFFQLFGKSLHLYCNGSTGFDPRKFWPDAIGETPEGISYTEATQIRYGRRAAELIHELIDLIAS
jgi:hypothetical protein